MDFQITKYNESDSTRNEEEENHLECLVEKMIKSGLSNQEILDEINTFMVAVRLCLLNFCRLINLLLGFHINRFCLSLTDPIFEF